MSPPLIQQALAWTHGPATGRRIPAGVEHLRGWLVAFAAVVLFALVYALRETNPDPVDAALLLTTLPIALCAIQFGLRGGLMAGLAGLVLVLAWDLYHPETEELGLVGFVTRGTAFLVLGGLLGRFADVRRALERKVVRAEELSLDLLATADDSGYFKRLNPAWERTLGHSLAELQSRPFVEFVHPDDRRRTQAETAKLVEDGIDTIDFRNRYLARDGSYRWLDWRAHADPEEGLIYASARDVTVQQEAEDAVRSQSDLLDQTVRERTLELEAARLETLERLALAAEFRDDDTQQHTERVGETAKQIGEALSLPVEIVGALRRAAPLHDLGKLGISDSILLKRGKLTAEEYRLMQEHTSIGAAILEGSGSYVLQMAAEVAMTHHERWDGTGYPRGLSGEDIPITGRITALADVFDALTHERPYKEAWTVERALAAIRLLGGSHFDPSVTAAFAELDHSSLVEHAGRPARALRNSAAERRFAASRHVESFI